MNVTKPVAFKRGIKITLTFTFFATIVLCSLLSQADAQQQQQGTKTRRNRGRVWSSTVSMIRRHHRPGELIFAEEFYSLDPNVWEHEIAAAGRTNGEFQMYDDDPANSYVRNGILFIKPTAATASNKYGERFLEVGDSGNIDFGPRCTDSSDFRCRRRARRGSNGDFITSPIASARIKDIISVDSPAQPETAYLSTHKW